MVFRNRILAILVAAAAATAFGPIDTASAAKKKLTYDQAYARCKAVMDKAGTPGVGINPNTRYTQGSACMKKYGYRL
jgi:hypothetical protein